MHPGAWIPVFDALRGAMPVSGSSLLAAGRAFSERAADLAATALWQGGLTACGLALCLRLAPRTSATHRFTVWAAAFFTLVSLPFLSLTRDLPFRTVSASSSPVAGHAAQPWLSVDARWSLAIAVVWVVVLLVRAIELAIHCFRLRTIWKEAKRVDVDGKLTSALQSVRGRVDVCTTTALDRPSVIGFMKPRILIPDWLLLRLTQGELEQIVLHEVEHLRRRDDWTNLAQKLCLVVFPLNPALVWIERRLSREREMACDEGVIRITRAPRAYAACLASLAERGLERRVEALSLGAWHRRPELVDRVHSILRGKRGLSPMGARVLTGTVGCGLLLGSVGFARCPQLVAFVPTKTEAAAQIAPEPVANALPLADADRDRKLVAKDATTRAPLARAAQPLSGARAVPVVFLSEPNSRMKTAAMSASGDRASANSSAGPNAVLAVNTSREERAADSPRAMTLKAEMARAQATPAVEEQQLVVFTTWERVEMTNPKANVQSDYDADAGTEHPADARTPGSPAENQAAGRVTVTRLILKVFPVSAGMNSPSGQATGQSGVATLHGGWLVFQL